MSYCVDSSTLNNISQEEQRHSPEETRRSKFRFSDTLLWMRILSKLKILYTDVAATIHLRQKFSSTTSLDMGDNSVKPPCHQERFSQNSEGWTVVKVIVFCEIFSHILVYDRRDQQRCCFQA